MEETVCSGTPPPPQGETRKKKKKTYVPKFNGEDIQRNTSLIKDFRLHEYIDKFI